jgi:predicted nucleic acid-binding protein
LETLSIAKSFVVVSDQTENRAKELNGMGLKPLDALHLACAEAAQVDYFCTCDDKFLKRAKTVRMVKTKVVGPIELIQEIER